MSQRGLEALLRPKSIAVIGASDKVGRAGTTMMKNLLSGGFNGPVFPVNPTRNSVSGVFTYPSIDKLPQVPDLAIICTHHRRNLELLEQLGQSGCKAVIVLSAQSEQFQAIKTLCQQYHIRLLGPNSLGLLAPWQGLNASFSPLPVKKGKLAFISQSAAVANTILDWAYYRNIGFSYFIALGDNQDIQVDDLLDFLARDSKTSAILLHLEHIHDARRFMSASRSASRNKPILVIKSGRTQKAQLLLGDTPSYDVAYDAAFQRAGLLRVQDTHEMFSAVETLSYMTPLKGEKLMIISNGSAPAAMAVDKLFLQSGKLAQLSADTQQQLQAIVQDTSAIRNPLNLGDDTTVERYIRAVNCLLDSHDHDALLLIHTPSAIAPSIETAQKVIEAINKHPRRKWLTLFTNWGGEYSSQQSRKLFSEAGIPTYRTPEGAITAFMHMVEYRRNQKQLKETPALPLEIKMNTQQAHRCIEDALDKKQYRLDTHQVQPIMEAYGFNTLPTWIAHNAQEAVSIAEKIGYPVALKLRSPDIPHKSEVQGVMLYLRDSNEVESAAHAIIERVSELYPQAKIQGLLVQSMANRAGSQELRVAIEQDPIFGPLILLGEGGVEWQIETKAAVALPPLNMALARYLVINAIKSGKLQPRSALQPLNILSLSHFLVQVSHLLLDCPQIVRLDIHPLLVSGNDFTLLDVAMELSPIEGDPHQKLSIRPYPNELEETFFLRDNKPCFIRPILPEDEPLLKTFINQVTKEDLYYRYFSEISEFTHDDLANMTQIDYDREMAFVAIRHPHDDPEIIGVARAMADPDNQQAEFAILVRSDLKGNTLGHQLMMKLINYTKTHGIKRLTAITMPENRNMISLAKKLGFSVEVQFDEGIVNLNLLLDPLSDV
ncbi:TPA: bifunctional acetate--CoA ligase family protein/GNAT family N-acetyltransferase [Proteus mirabilis]|uniref:bifunctional acetate--CoA ligase family protein/GNAT family N-acetyltransferase n=1 Tax=Proteus mirabilis TaxID=584 RepID=UPI0013D88672|nr:bifunctional acetate--CoA ligase family protein/GNAT family N-acetyltransferase [Proteus mirabilis]MBG2849246.1 bifunctional acetate--CoA ligase family protein/GNAT family N-acetyltransferase [Proteus mirabilis]MBG3123938.1 bifunctional acetate--CoA ligase family protein/GNAT family N-acetyltransferase [Proteus mirabilis]MBI6294316.1 bifunctional acetate--CoA ligase family protein/GNAT family N-acetyltransferase [Proteus mirabilis]MBI6325308.1 bifunctional acetate--CoA ligase family protein/